MSSEQSSNRAIVNIRNIRETLQRATDKPTNISQGERLGSLVGGGLLTLFGLTKGSLAGLLLGGGLLYRGATGHSVLYDRLHVNRAEHPFPSSNISKLPGGAGFRVHRAMTIQANPEQLYDTWRDVERAPAYMPMVREVRKTGEKSSRWLARGPQGQRLEWDIEIVREEPGRLIEWRVLNNPMLENSGRVRFTAAPGGRGTIAILEMDFAHHRKLQTALEMPLLGRATDIMLETQVAEILHRFKSLVEAGEVPTIKGQPTGRQAEEGVRV